MTAADRFLDALAAHGHKVKTAGRDRWRAQCPAHGGGDLNLSVARGDQGVLVRCWSRECSESDIASALGLSVGDLFDRDGRAEYHYGGGHVVTRTRTGTGKRISQRQAPEVTSLWTPAGSEPIDTSPVVVLAEGEKTADALVRLGARCVATWPGGSSAVGKVDLTPLTGRRVVIAPDADEAGERALSKLTERLRGVAAEASIWRVPQTYAGHPINDAADLWTAGGTLDDLAAEAAPAAESGARRSLFVDVAAMLDGATEPISPSVGGRRDDGLRLLYAGRVNVLVGDPETGKTFVAAAMAVQALRDGGSVLWVDLDHNGRSVVERLVMLGADPAALRDPLRFRFAEPDDSATLDAIIADTAARPVALAVVDSLGELLPMYGASSDSADDFTATNRRTLVAIARSGAAVLVLDHLAKGAASREYGGTGTIAKKRAVDGAMYRVTTPTGFAPGRGGTARLGVVKDRHGGVRSRTVQAPADREPVAAMWNLWTAAGEDTPRWTFAMPPTSPVGDSAADLALIATLRPTSKRDARARSGISHTRSDAAYDAWKAAPR